MDDRRFDALAKALSARLPRRAALGLLAAFGPAAGAAAVRPAPPRPGGKEPVCHRGKTRWVAPAAVLAHLAHGDDPGPCGRPRGLDYTYIRLKVVNAGIYPSILATYWDGTIGWTPAYESMTRPGTPDDTFIRITSDLHAGVELPSGPDRSAPFVWVENPIIGDPNVTIQNGGSMGVFGYQGGTTLVDHRRLLVDEEVSQAAGDRTFTVRRDRPYETVRGFLFFTVTIS